MSNANPFKAGDRVTVVDRGPNTGLLNGQTYTVKRVSLAGRPSPGVYLKEGTSAFYYSRRFKLATEYAASAGGVGLFGTGKGTTAKIREFFQDKNMSYSAAEVGEALGLPGRQLNKRLVELSDRGELNRTKVDDRIEYRLAI